MNSRDGIRVSGARLAAHATGDIGLIAVAVDIVAAASRPANVAPIAWFRRRRANWCRVYWRRRVNGRARVDSHRRGHAR